MQSYQKEFIVNQYNIIQKLIFDLKDNEFLEYANFRVVQLLEIIYYFYDIELENLMKLRREEIKELIIELYSKLAKESKRMKNVYFDFVENFK